jgi:hypothetical protein
MRWHRALACGVFLATVLISWQTIIRAQTNYPPGWNCTSNPDLSLNCGWIHYPESNKNCDAQWTTCQGACDEMVSGFACTNEGELGMGGDHNPHNVGACNCPGYCDDLNTEECAAREPQCQNTGSGCSWAAGSPIVIALDRETRYEFTSAEAGVMFDIQGDGKTERIAWTHKGSALAFLAIDADGDGRITSGKELFGNYTMAIATNGFDALQKMVLMTNGGVVRNSITADDPLLSRLLLWTDKNHNGISESGELRPAAEVVDEIGLDYVDSKRTDQHGNWFAFKGWIAVGRAEGRPGPRAAERRDKRPIWDVYLTIAWGTSSPSRRPSTARTFAESTGS